jgi:hypothetical protein
MKIIETIFDAQTQETTVVERDMTNEELVRWQELETAKNAQIEAENEALAKRQAALDKLAALGLEPDDLKALGL